MLRSARDEAAPLLGRSEEEMLLTSLLDEVGSRGHALVLRGGARLFAPEAINNRHLHIPCNRDDGLPEQLIKGREDPFFRYEFAIQGGGVPNYAVKCWPSAGPSATARTSASR